MKIGDVKVGDILALDCASRYSRFDPRAVEVLEIVTVEQSYFTKHSILATRNVRRVKVKMVDPPAYDNFHAGMAGLQQGVVALVDARDLITTWAELAPGIAKKVQAKAELRALEAKTEARLKALGLKPGAFAEVSIRVYGKRLEVDFSGASLEHFLKLAEAGLAAGK